MDRGGEVRRNENEESGADKEQPEIVIQTLDQVLAPWRQDSVLKRPVMRAFKAKTSCQYRLGVLAP